MSVPEPADSRSAPRSLTGPDQSSFGVVLFDLPAERLPAVAASLRRFARQPLQFRWLPTADDEPGRVLVRVEAPPPLVVDRVAAFGRVYVQAAAGDWVELGRGTN